MKFLTEKLNCNLLNRDIDKIYCYIVNEVVKDSLDKSVIEDDGIDINIAKITCISCPNKNS